MVGRKVRGLLPEALLVAAANLLPAAGVLAWGWQGVDIVVLYWAEMVIGGMCFVLTVLIAAGPATVRDRLAVAAVLSAMFGVIALVTLAVIGGLLGGRAGVSAFPMPGILAESLPRVRLGLAAFALSHLASMVIGLAGNKVVLARAIYLWFTGFGQRVPVIFGAVLLTSAVTLFWPSGPVWLVGALALVVLKTVVEVRATLHEPAPAPEPSGDTPAAGAR